MQCSAPAHSVCCSHLTADVSRIHIDQPPHCSGFERSFQVSREVQHALPLVTEPSDREMVWCTFAWPTVIWSYSLIIGWEWKAGPKLDSMTEMMDITPAAAVYTFRVLFWLHLVGFTIAVVSNTLLIFTCDAKGETFVSQKVGAHILLLGLAA